MLPGVVASARKVPGAVDDPFVSNPDKAVTFLESWKTYADTAALARRWVYMYGNGGALHAKGMRLPGNIVSYCNTHITPTSRIRGGFWFTPETYAPSVSNSSFFHLCQGGETNNENNTGFGCNPDGTLSVFTGSNFSGYGGTTIANGTTPMALNVPVWIEFDILFAKGTGGRVEVRLNGVPEILVEGVNTAPNRAPYVNVLSFTAGADANHIYGEIYLGDGSLGWLGPQIVELLPLTGAGDVDQFSPAAGITALNDNSNTTYVSASQVNAASEYAIAAPQNLSGKINAVQVSADAVQLGTGRPFSILSYLTDALTKRYVGSKGFMKPTFPLSLRDEARGVTAAAPDGKRWTRPKLAAVKVGVRLPQWAKGFNFRGSAAYATDSLSNNYVLNDVYPTTRKGVTFGWNIAGSGVVTYDRVTDGGEILAGINCQENNGLQRTFTVDVPAPGRYELRLAVGDPAYAQDRVYAVISDDTTPLFTIDSTVGDTFTPVVGGVIDASGKNQNNDYKQWHETNRARYITLTSTKLKVTIGTPTASTLYTCISHLELIALDEIGTLGDANAANDVRLAGLYVETLIAGVRT